MHTIQVSVHDKIATQTDGTVIINGNWAYQTVMFIGIFAYNDAAAHKAVTLAPCRYCGIYTAYTSA